jgi:hypothetical protein
VECAGPSASSFRGLRVRVRPGRIVPRERPPKSLRERTCCPSRTPSVLSVSVGVPRNSRRRRSRPSSRPRARQHMERRTAGPGNLHGRPQAVAERPGWSGRPEGQSRHKGRHGARVPGAATRCRLVGMTAGRRRTKRGAMGLNRARATTCTWPCRSRARGRGPETGRGPLGRAELPPTPWIVHVAAAGPARGCRAAGGPAPR